MSRLPSLFLLSVGSLVLSLGPVAARGDSIPTLTATSATLIGNSGGYSWEATGDSFSVGGGFLQQVTLADAVPGQALSPSEFSESSDNARVYFTTTRGASDEPTTGTVTLAGVTHSVLFLGTGYVSFPSDEIYNPAVLPPPQGNSDGSSRVFSGPATVSAESDSGSPYIELQEMFCDPRFVNSQSCYGNVIADLNIDVPGIATLTGVSFPGQPFDGIMGVNFTSTPEPASYSLTIAGMAAALLFAAFRRRRYKRR